MKEYISPNEAFMMLDKGKIKERGKRLKIKNPLAHARLVFNRMIWEGRIFYVVCGSKILLQKDSVINAYPDFIKEEFLNSVAVRELLDREIPEPHISALQVEGFDNQGEGNMLVDDIFCDYHLHLPSLKSSLEGDGLFPFLDCTCGYMGCDGRYVQVMNLSDDIVVWVMLCFREEHPVKSLNGYLIEEDDYREYVRLNLERDGKEERFKARDIVHASKQVFIPLPLFFPRKQLEELVERRA